MNLTPYPLFNPEIVFVMTTKSQQILKLLKENMR